MPISKITRERLETILGRVRRFADVNSSWAISVGTVVIGAWVSLFSSEIRGGTKLFFAHALTLNKQDNLTIDFFLVVFWVILCFWSFFLYMHLSGTRNDDIEKRHELLRAIHKMPNISVLYNYPKWYELCTEAINYQASDVTSEKKLQLLQEQLQAVLILVAKLAHDFSRKTEGVRFGANIMLVAAKEDFSPAVISCLRFHEKTSVNSLKGILYLPESLIVHDHAVMTKQGVIPVISLPVPNREVDQDGAVLALPGAPTALLSGDFNVYEDTTMFLECCKDFAQPVKNEAIKYFSKDGEGCHIKSFASFRIGTATDPVGVLNIDCSEDSVLGPHSEFYVTFEALITPVLILLRRCVSEYASYVWPILQNNQTVTSEVEDAKS